MVERKVRVLLCGIAIESMVAPGELAFAITALYLGIDMLSHLDGERTGAESLLVSGFERHRSARRC